MIHRFPPPIRALVIAALALVTAAGCTSDDAGTNSKPPDVDTRTVVDEVSLALTEDGGTLALDNGMALMVPAGAVSGTVEAELVEYEGDTNFRADHQTVLGISTDGDVSSGTLAVPLEPGQDTSLVGAAFMHDDSIHVQYLDHTFSGSLDTMYVSLTGYSTLAANASAVSSGTVVVSRGIPHTPISVGEVFEIPYYQQDEGNCWAACILILAKSYKSSIHQDEIYELLHSMDVERNAGLSWYNMGAAKSKCESLTGFTAQKNTWIVFRNFLQYVFKRIEEKKPVMVNLITHQAIICGFEIENPGPDETTYLIMHDPANWEKQKPYMRMSLDDLVSTYWNQTAVSRLVNYFVTVDFLTSKLTSPALQTIHLQSADLDGISMSALPEGIAFGERGRIVNRIQWDHTDELGYSLRDAEDIAPGIDMIKIAKTPVWNTDRDASGNVEIKTRLYRVVDGVFRVPALVEKVNVQTIPPISAYYHTVEIEIDEFIDDLTPADSTFALEMALFNSENTRIDDFEVLFEWRPLRITQVYPDIGEAGDEVEIWGIGFGHSQGTSTIEFNGVEAEIVDWNNDEITAKVPPGASSGDITVHVGSATSNGMPFTVLGGVLDLLHETVEVTVQVYAEHTYSRNYVSRGGMAYSADTLQWAGTAFGINKTIGDNYQTVTVTGTVSEDGRVVEHIDVYFRENRSLITTFHMVLDSIPLVPWYTPQDNVFYEFEVDGSTYAQHVTTMVNTRIFDDGEDFQSYISTNWNTPSAPPEIRITFVKNP